VFVQLLRGCRGRATKIRDFEFQSWQFTALVSAVLVLFYNDAFWGEMLRLRAEFTAPNLAFMVASFLLLWALVNLLLSLVAFRFLLKGMTIVLLLTGASVGYFMDTYGVLIDHTMIQNVVETDAAEAADLITLRLVVHMAVFGLLPCAWVAMARVRYRRAPGQVLHALAGVTLSALAGAAVVLAYYQDYASLFRNERHLRYLVTPSNYLYATWKYAAERMDSGASVMMPIGTDAARGPLWQEHRKPVLLVLVVGETARAENFALNGYARPTTPRLQQEGVLNFSNVHACGTATATSLPCMFSQLSRSDYDDTEAHSQEGLLDVLAHAGIPVLWRENSSGCKGVCDRVTVERRQAFATPELCDDSQCFDEALLNGLDELLAARREDRVIVLHQLGSHGPAYYRRYPKAQERFTPVCTTGQLQSCDRQAIVNAYDNTILYTDHVLGKVVDLLKSQGDRYDTAMIYISDHGESLGEHNIYLHGLPYLIAPDVQKHIPLAVWLSHGFRQNFAVDTACLARQANRPYSHDHLFHSVLGLLDIRTRVYDARLDMFAACRRPA